MKRERFIITIIAIIVAIIVFLTYTVIELSINPKGYCCPYFIYLLNIAIYYIYIFLVAVLFILITFLLRIIKSAKVEKFEKDEAIEILRKRYASGEITKEEYERMLQDLKKGK
ncbi:MAG: SHOCT domain-containing protein [Thermoplasmata archaeon]